MHVGGGINGDNAEEWLEAGAEKVIVDSVRVSAGGPYDPAGPPVSTLRTLDRVADAPQVIVTSWLFPESKFDIERLQRLSKRIGKNRLVVDIS